MMRAASLILGLFLAQPAVPESFEVASVKRANPTTAFASWRGGPGTADPGQITYTNVSLGSVILTAYDVGPYQLSAPTWLNTEKYDIAATIPPGTTREQFRTMLQSLLAERFHLTLHRETKEVPVYALSLGKNGSKLKESAGPSTPAKESLPPAFRQLSPQTLSLVIQTTYMTTSTRVFMAGQARPASWIAESLQIPLGRPVIDRTGLTGNYDYYYDFAPESLPAGAPADPSDPAPSVFTALEQLGLKLEETRVPFDVLIVDSAEKTPTDN